MYVTNTSLRLGNTGKLWNYTRNQKLSWPRSSCRKGILTCFHLLKPACVYVVACWSLYWCIRSLPGTHTGVHSGNTGKLWNYTRNQNLPMIQ